MMIENSSPMGQFRYKDENDLKERLGHRDPPIGVSLFTGAGGFDLGFEWAGFDVRVMVEQEETACDTLRLNMDAFSEHTEPTIIQKDICEVSTSEILDAAGVGIGGVTAVFGGPPCQGFSLAGNRDPDDERNALYREMVRIVHRAKPLYFVMENVPGLATMEGGDVIQRVCDEFRQGGYNVKWDILNAANYGVPQKRRRTFIMGNRIDVVAQPQTGNPLGRPQVHIGAVSGRVDHPDYLMGALSGIRQLGDDDTAADLNDALHTIYCADGEYMGRYIDTSQELQKIVAKLRQVRAQRTRLQKLQSSSAGVLSTGESLD